MTAWIYLALAAVFEIAFATSMKYAAGFTKIGPSIVTAIATVGGITFLTLALKTLPLSIAYPIWTGVGTLGTVILGLLLFNEAITPLKLISVLAIIAGIVGLKASLN
jgi:quaternary ammonium compound-resistance protein SugE